MKHISDSHAVEMKQNNLIFIAIQHECKYVVIFSQMCVHIQGA